MNEHPQIIVNKRSGFLTALAHGFFGLLIAVVLVVAVVVVTGVYFADRNIGQVIALTRDAGGSLREWREFLPPAISEALEDRRAPDYRNALEIEALVADADAQGVSSHSHHNNSRYVLVRVSNRGDEVISLLTGRIVLYDANRVPVHEKVVAVATPFALDIDREDKWRGPLWPGQTREFVATRAPTRGEYHAEFDLADLRTWVEPLSRDVRPAIAPPAPPQPASVPPAAPQPSVPPQRVASPPQG